MGRVLVWRRQVLPASETFIRNQIDAMSRWQPTLVGDVRTVSAISDPGDTILFGRNRVSNLQSRVDSIYAKRFNRVIQRVSPDLIHAHFVNDACKVARLCAKNRIPLVVTAHGWDVTSLDAWMDTRNPSKALELLVDTTSKFLAVSEFIAGRLRTLGVPREMITVCPIGVPTEAVPGTDSASRDVSGTDILFVGRLVAKKGCEDLLNAAFLAEKIIGRTLRLQVVGEGPLRPVLERQASALGLDARFSGAQTPRFVNAEMGTAKVFVAPSRTAPGGDSEGFGMVFLEAALAGTPVLAYRHGGVPEAVQDRHTALLCDEGDVSSLAKNIARLLNDPNERRTMGLAGRRRVIEQFNIIRCTTTLESIYDDTVRSG